MATCRDCNAFVVFLKKVDGSFYPPFDPVSDVDLSDLFVSTEQGMAANAPQLFRKHRCVSAEEKIRIQAEREAERQRLIEADRERRRIARETEEALEAQRAEAERIAEENRRALEAAQEEAFHEEFTPKPDLRLVESDDSWFDDDQPDEDATLKERLERRRKVLRTAFRAEAKQASWWQFRTRSAERLKQVRCRGCGALPDKPCWRSEQPSEIELLGEDLARHLGKLGPQRKRVYVSAPKWFADQPCSARWAGAPALPRVLPRRRYFGEDEHPTWPPEFPTGEQQGTGYVMAPLTPEQIHAGAGRYEMAEFLKNNVDLFNVGSDASPDTFRKPRRFLTSAEVSEMAGWLADHGPILWEEATTNQVSPDEYERWIDDGGRVAGDVGEEGGEAGRAASDCG